ncbi:hypothetical protein QVD17_25444 [Tagetes erecta]|uniref:TF-B3 domain-containing protein n=1 Tax=Tagetes erecta TaxID=13708 RepID=A0AAD8KGI5_TARER|nr:hypothetical protein QVD17_25444 [Tagetes erecta]
MDSWRMGSSYGELNRRYTGTFTGETSGNYSIQHCIRFSKPVITITKKGGPMAKACEECALNCDVIHRRKKDPSPIVTTFFKVMMGDDYSKTLFLPPQFARTVKNLADKKTYLEDFNGQKWLVKVTKIDGRWAFKEGWNGFALNHGLQMGDFLVFHCIKRSHFVVFMYGSTGCPENRHFGFSQNPMKETEKNDNTLPVNSQSPSEVNTICNEVSHESSSKSEPLVHGANDMETINNKLNEPAMSPNENTTNIHQLVALSSQPVDKETNQRSAPLVKETVKETDKRSEPVVKNTVKETDQRSALLVINTDKENYQRSEPLVKNTDKETYQRSAPLVKNKDKETYQRSAPLTNNTDKETYQRPEALVKKSLADYMVPKSPSTMKPSCLVDNGNGHEADECRRNILQSVAAESNGGQKNNAVAGGGGSDETKISRIPKELETRIKIANEKRKESTMRLSEATHSNSMHKKLRPDNVLGTPEKIIKKEPDTSASRLHDSGYHFTSPGISPKPTSQIKLEPKPEPVDCDDAPLSVSSNPSFSAIMSSYQYLELPGWVKLKSRVILLRNGTDLWAVLFQTKLGVKALTQNWGTFAKEKGIKLGDMCHFVLESDPSNRFTCSVFGVRVTRQ